jgi:methionine synthase II (cobalamin-independent)
VHCCHPTAPIPVLRRAGADGLALDLTDASPARWESVAATVEAGQRLYAGLLPTDGTGPVSVSGVARRLLEEAERVGLDPGLLASVVVSPACGLAGATREGAISTQRAALDLAREVGAALDAG